MTIPRSEAGDDARLLRGWQQGDAAAGDALYRRYKLVLVQYFRRQVEVNDVADLVQETFLRCQKAVYREEGSVRGFLFGVAYRLRHEHWRRCHRQVWVSDEDLLERSCAEFDDDPEYVMIQDQDVRVLMKAMRRIPKKYQLVLEKGLWCELTQREIAAILVKPEGTIRRWTQEAERALEAKVEELATSPELREATTMTLASWRRWIGAQVLV